jgi:hypothetical protein
MEGTGGVHHRIEIDIDHLIPPLTGEFLPPVTHRALTQNQYIDRAQIARQPVSRRSVGEVELAVIYAGEVAILGFQIVARIGPGAGDGHLRSALAEAVGDAVPDPARPADDEHAFAGEVERFGHVRILPQIERLITSFMISFVPPKMRVTRASRHSRAMAYSFM